MNSTPRCQCFAGYAIETCFTEVWTAVRSSMTHSALCCSKLETQGRKSKAVRQEKCVVRVSVYNIYMYITYTIFFFLNLKKKLSVCVCGRWADGPLFLLLFYRLLLAPPCSSQIQNKAEADITLSLSLAVSLSRQSRNSPPFLLLLPHFVFEAGRGRSWALVHFLFAVHEINPYKNAKLGNLLFLSLKY